MKKFKLAALALLGINMGMLLSSYSSNNAEMTPEMRSFYEMLDPNAQRQFMELDTEHRRAAMAIMYQYCQRVHECKGLREKAVQDQYYLQKQSNR